MNYLEQIEVLKEALDCGPSRYELLVPDIYDIYRHHNLCPQACSVSDALAEVEGKVINLGAI